MFLNNLEKHKKKNINPKSPPSRDPAQKKNMSLLDAYQYVDVRKKKTSTQNHPYLEDHPT